MEVTELGGCAAFLPESALKDGHDKMCRMTSTFSCDIARRVSPPGAANLAGFPREAPTGIEPV